MKPGIADLIATLATKGELMQELKRLLNREQSCLVALDLAGLEETQQEIARAMERMAEVSDLCRSKVAALGEELGLTGRATLSPIIERMQNPEKGALREAQTRVTAQARALEGAVTLNRGLLEDSLKVVEYSVNFFNRLFNPGDTYGFAGALVSRRGGSRFVCKEI